MKLCVILALTASAPAGLIVSLNPTADSFVSSANPARNFGSAGALDVSGTGTLKGEFDSLLRFDLATAKTQFDIAFGAGQWAIDSVTLRLTTATPNNSIFNNPNAAGSVFHQMAVQRLMD